PGGPGRARAESSVPASAGIERADELEEAGGRGVEVGRQLGDLVTQVVERARVHGEAPFCSWGRLYTRVSGPPGRRANRRSRRHRHFFDERIRDGIAGRLWTAGVEFIRCCRHAATALARDCQGEIAGDTPLPST